MSDQQLMRINLSLVSHTNIGKTTLARTLLGRDIGEVADRPHVTETNDDYVLIRASDGCSELVLWDTPGFGDSVRLAKRLEGRANPIGWFMSEVWDRMSNKALWLNQRALKHVRDTSSVVLYLVNASESPQACSYIAAEMQILSWIGKPVIVLLNQMGKPREQDIEEAELKRWQDYMGQYPLVKNVLPLIKRHHKNISLEIIGNWSETAQKEVHKICKDIKFLGFVDDLGATIQDSLMIVPINIGSGIRMKILEAANYSVPFVSTIVGVEGLDFEDNKECFICKTPEGMAEKIVKLIQNKDLFKSFSINVHKKFVEKYSIEALGQKRLSLYE